MPLPFISKTPESDRLPIIIRQLLNTAKADTVFWDLYSSRARQLLEPLLSHADYRSLEKERAGSALLPDQIRTAMEQGDWNRTKELSSRLATIRKRLVDQRPLIELGQMLYDNPLMPIDPFSPGLQGFAGVTGSSALAELKEKTVQGLRQLQEMDAERRPLYAARQGALQNLVLSTDEKSPKESAPLAHAQLQQEALEAFKRGNFDRLGELAKQLTALDGKDAGGEEGLADQSFGSEDHEFAYTFSEKTLAAAADLGLTVAHADSWHEKYSHLCRFAWHPAIGSEGSLPGKAHRVFDGSMPPDTPEAMKERIKMFMIHPFISSGGSRYLPSLVAEDFLVEDFADPQPGQGMPQSPLLEALHLVRRDQLSRLTIEQALNQHGMTIIETLGLDPMDFRLVCIPPDLHLRFGQQQGWGQQPTWTHFDGYMIQRDGHRMALAGGDVRFGGVFDMVGIGINYESDRVFARFAVVQRKRMIAW